jgi:tetratricopeptide (TPR) repeat protein
MDANRQQGHRQFRLKLLTAALLCVAASAGGVAVGTLPASARDVDPLLGIDGACQPGGQRGAMLKSYIRLAAAKNELKPFGRDLERADAQHDDAAQTKPPLWSNLGSLSFPVTTANVLAQRYFDQGLRLAYGFNHAEAGRAFRYAQTLDPHCAMCYWGEALVLGPNINAPMQAEAQASALQAAQRARDLASRVSAKEQALIEAISARYSADPKAERSALDAAYAERMRAAAQRFPKDDHIAVLTAEALMDLQPWDYWAPDGKTPKGNAAEIVNLLETTLKRNPNHPGAIHYYIHAVEASSEPQRAERHAERLAKLTPGAGHLVHMPSHIFFRLGRYIDSLEVNKAAVAADEAYIARVKAAGIYPQAYYPHAIHMLMVSAQMAGDGNAAISAAEKLAQVVSDEAARTIAWVQPIKAAPYFAHAQFSEPQRVLALPDPGNELPYVKGLWHYARGVASASAGDIEQAKQELARVRDIADSTDWTVLTTSGVPATDVLSIAQHVVQGRIDQAEGDLRAAATAFEQAVAVEDKLAYMEPPFWYYPVRQSLGAVLVQLGALDRAEEAFRTSLARAPNNGWSLYGLQEVYRKRGDDKSARAIERRLAQAWAGTRQQLSLKRL